MAGRRRRESAHSRTVVSRRGRTRCRPLSPVVPLLAALTGLVACAPPPAAPPLVHADEFEAEIEALRAFFAIPGLSILVKQGRSPVYERQIGFADLEKGIPVDAGTTFPIASLTKTISTVLLLQLVEEGALSLDDQMSDYSERIDRSADIRVRHILSHTSEGRPGEDFLYSGRFALGRRIIEQASGRTYADLMQSRIFDRAGMTDTLPMIDRTGLDAVGNRAARPYSYQGDTVPGQYEFGFSTATGLASTARDLARFDDALDGGELLPAARVAEMQTAFRTSGGEALPYGLGTFVQTFLGEKLVWSYGQADCFSSLYLKVPDRDLTLIILANNNLMSDPARLRAGDVTDSLFALGFLKHFVYRLPDTIPFSTYLSSDELATRITPLAVGGMSAFYRQELLAHALAAAFFGMSDAAAMSRSRSLLGLAYRLYPDLDGAGDLSLLRNLNLVTVIGGAGEFGAGIERIGGRLLSRHPEDPFVNLLLGSYYAHIGSSRKAADHYRTIVNARNYEPGWYTEIAADFLSQER